MKGYISAELDPLIKILLNNYHTKIDSSSDKPVLKIHTARQINILMK